MILNTGDYEKNGVKCAEKLKKFMDKIYGPHWHVFFGTNFGC